MKLNLKKTGKYFLNCFLLLIPIFIWNIIFTSNLPIGYRPEIFDNNIPSIISNGENMLRITLFLVPVIMIFSLKSKVQKIGIGLYFLGIIVYFLSWSVQIYFPDSLWSKSIFGFMAPAYTTIIWFTGIGLIGKHTFFKIPFMSFIYILLSVCFVIFHSIHAYIVYQQLT